MSDDDEANAIATRRFFKQKRDQASLAYEQAQRLIAEAKKLGSRTLLFNMPTTHALKILPPEIAALDELRTLSIDNTQVADLTPIAGLVGITVLSLSNTKVVDLTPIAGMREITRLSFSNTQVADLTPIVQMERMMALVFENTQVADLTPIAGMVGRMAQRPGMVWLRFENCAAARADARIAEIAEMKDDTAKATALSDYLKDGVPPGEVGVPATPFLFLSYSNANRPKVAGLRDFLVGQGVPIWWDQDIPAGARWRSDIEDQLAAARAIVTFWTAESVASAAVIEEASTAQKNGRLVPVLWDDSVLPYGFGETQYIDLRGWDGTATHPQMRKLLQALLDRLAAPDADEMAARLLAASPIAMLPNAGVLAPVDTPPNIRPEVVNAPDLAQRIEGLKQNLSPLRAMAADRDQYQFPADLGHALASVHVTLYAERLSWYGILDARATLCDCMEDHDARASWNTTMFKGLDRLTQRMAELRPLLQPRQVPADAPGAKPPEPEPLVKAADIANVANLAAETAVVLASPEAGATLDPSVNAIVQREIERIQEAARSPDEGRKFAKLRKGVRGLAYVTGAIISGVTIGVGTNLLTAPEAAATLVKQLQPIFERLLQMFL